MNDFGLITHPVKQFKIKMQLIGGKKAFFPALRHYILWEEHSEKLWSELAEKTWREVSIREDPNDIPDEVVQEMSGDVISFAHSIDGNSDVRRTISASIHLDNPAYFESAFVTVWLNNLIRVQIGLYDFDNKKYKWFKLGSYLVTANDYFYNAQTKQLNLSLVDLMAAATEHRGNAIGTEVVIETGTNIQEAVIGTVERFFPFTFNNVCDFDKETIPYDLEFERGIYPYEITKKMVGLYPGYEHFYTPDGTYTVQSIPMGVSEDYVLTADQMDQLIISEQGSSNPQAIKNVTEVWGKELDADRTAESCDSSTYLKTYHIHLHDSFEVLDEGMIFSFTPDKDGEVGQRLKIQDTPAYPIVNESGIGERTGLMYGEMKAGVQYVMKYTNQVFVLLGQSIIHAMCFFYSEYPDEETLANLKAKYACNDIVFFIDRDSPFTIENIGERVQVFTGGEFEDIYTTNLAKERASYETWRSARTQDTLQLEMIYVPWLDVNQKVRYKSIVTGEENDYLVQSIQVQLETFTMNVVLNRYHPFYPWLRTSKTWGDYKDTEWGNLKELYWDEVAYPPEEE